jgi:hypothetical protein
MNLVNEQGDWDDWSKNLSSQMLSKQSPKLAESQLDKMFQQKQAEFDEINSLTNPVVKKQLLQEFADDCDASAVHLKAAAMPRQATKVLIPIPDLADNECYAPSFNDGEELVLIRYPHGGIFEIPTVTVNNRNTTGKKRIGPDGEDAIGINKKVADQLSGADFDGDQVLAIPNRKGPLGVKTKSPLKELEGFDPKIYKLPDAKDADENYIYPTVKNRTKQIEMGKVSNLITDMTIKGATDAEIARAVKHSMVVIDSEKHRLNYKQSAIDNGIDELKKRYQAGGGVSTLISRSSHEIDVPQRKQWYGGNGGIDPVTGKKVYTDTGATYTNKKGQTKTRTQKSSLMYETPDARILSSGQVIEEVYASHANRLKNLGNQARKETLNLKPLPYSPSANKTYSKQVASLDIKLTNAKHNAPKERQAQLFADADIKKKKAANPDMGGDELKKIKGRAIVNARIRVGASKPRIVISSDEWDAIQAGAISTSKLLSILANADNEVFKNLATPRSTTSALSAEITKRIKIMKQNGYTIAQIANGLGLSVQTVKEV